MDRISSCIAIEEGKDLGHDAETTNKKKKTKKNV
jgi:hypothetical protein